MPFVTFSDRMVLRRGTREIQLLYLGVGNTAGDAVVYLPAEKVVIAGDLVVSPSPYESGMFSPEWLETSKKLASLDFAHLVPGHGDAQHDHDYVNYLNKLFAEIIRQVEAAYLSGKTRIDDIQTVVTHQSVVESLNREAIWQRFTAKLDPGFVPAAVQTSFRRIIQGKQ